jgi:hypothetical protein
MNIISGQKDLPLNNIVRGIEKQVFEWRGKSQLDDAISLIALERDAG